MADKVEVECIYKEKCSDCDKFCFTCKHNERRSYYEPTPYPTYPLYPYYSTYPYYRNDTITITDMDSSSCYEPTS